jgi:hypothetical protein
LPNRTREMKKDSIALFLIITFFVTPAVNASNLDGTLWECSGKHRFNFYTYPDETSYIIFKNKIMYYCYSIESCLESAALEDLDDGLLYRDFGFAYRARYPKVDVITFGLLGIYLGDFGFYNINKGKLKSYSYGFITFLWLPIFGPIFTDLEVWNLDCELVDTEEIKDYENYELLLEDEEEGLTTPAEDCIQDNDSCYE